MPQQRDSLLAQHYRILGYSGEVKPEDQQEAERIERLRLPALNLPAAKPKRSFVRLTLPQWGGLAALAAALTLMILFNEPSEPDDGVRMKGAHHISVFWERDGAVQPWSKDENLIEGDRVRAEILASEPVVAYTAITDPTGRLLIEPEQVLASAQKLEAGERKAFPGSFKLVGPSENEVLVVLVCEKTTLLTGLLKDAQERVLTQNKLPKGCDLQPFPLR